MEKAELIKCSWYPKRKFGVTKNFSEIVNLRTFFVVVFFVVVVVVVVVFCPE